ncbi:hypothetical protein I4U23_015704 [Adineta vaga]|nr:hypothetical protein I4U23_015704 [Adineta vaga]
MGSKRNYNETIVGILPHGIFIDTKNTVYVVNVENGEVVIWFNGESRGITVAGKESLKLTIELYQLSGVVLNNEKYLFIVDQETSRIINEGPNDFRCIIACDRKNSSPDSLLDPFTLIVLIVIWKYICY